MTALLDRPAPDRDHLVGWVAEHASLATTGRTAARWITEDLRRASSAR